MGKKRSWSDEELQFAVATSYSYRTVLIALKLIPAGGNYAQVQERVRVLGLDATHFTGMLWNKGKKLPYKPHRLLEDMLVVGDRTQSYGLKDGYSKKGLDRRNASSAAGLKWAMMVEFQLNWIILMAIIMTTGWKT